MPSDDAEAAYWRAWALDEQGRSIDAIEVWEEAIALGAVAALHGLGNSLWSLERLEEAADAFTRAAQAGHTDAWQNLGLVRMDQCRHHDAVAPLQAAVRAGDTCAWSPLGTALLDLGDRAGARQAFTAATEADDPEGMRQLAYSDWEDGRLDAAIELAERAHAAGHPHAESEAVVWRWEHTGDVTLEDRLRQAHRYPEARVALARLLLRTGRLDEAIAELEDTAAAGHVVAMVPLGNMHWDERDDPQSAERAYRMAVDRDDQHGVTNLGILLAALDRNTEAAELLSQAAAWGDPIARRHLVTLPHPHTAGRRGGNDRPPDSRCGQSPLAASEGSGILPG